MARRDREKKDRTANTEKADQSWARRGQKKRIGWGLKRPFEKLWKLNYPRAKRGEGHGQAKDAQKKSPKKEKRKNCPKRPCRTKCKKTGST